jgi:hypothetical protein
VEDEREMKRMGWEGRYPMFWRFGIWYGFVAEYCMDRSHRKEIWRPQILAVLLG